ncbi:MAG: 16S rRNA (guanine(966)-N(2))-methyltransferase RsmD [Planctomycetes bacterium]|nr:16S rRNA (guanine(966)-N(2))-methyltransferase RsmD [Planctomycetota bacterium]
MPLRIIAGKYRRRLIEAPEGERTRPMLDRTRTMLFDTLGPEVVDAVVLDAFAGTGALGFESLSRGARKAYFFEIHRPTFKLIEANAKTLGATENCEFISGSAFNIDALLGKKSVRFDVAFISPPYAFYESKTDELAKLYKTLAEKFMNPGSLLVVEHPPATQIDVYLQVWAEKHAPQATLSIFEV